MANAVPSRLGQVNQANGSKALFLKVFSGEVLTAFETAAKLKDKVRTRSIASGKSAQFPATFKVTPSYHVPGSEIVGTPISHNEIVVTIDDLLIANVFIALIDEAMNHYDVRGPYSSEMGRALALYWDRNVIRCLVKAAKGAALFAGDMGGTTLVNAAYATTGQTIIDGINLARQTLDSKDVDVDTMPTYAAFLPAQWYLISQADKNINKFYQDGSSVRQNAVTQIGDVNVIKTNAPTFGNNESALSSINAKYRLDLTNTRSVVFTEDAAATVQLLGLSMESTWDARRQGTLLVGKYAIGHDALRTKCSVELAIA